MKLLDRIRQFWLPSRRDDHALTDEEREAGERKTLFAKDALHGGHAGIPDEDRD